MHILGISFSVELYGVACGQQQTWNKFLDKDHNANKGQNAMFLHSVRSKCPLHVQSTPCTLEYSVVDVALFNSRMRIFIADKAERKNKHKGYRHSSTWNGK